MTSRTQNRIGWGLGVLIALFLIVASGLPKFVNWDGKAEMLQHMGISEQLLPAIGVVEISLAILFLISRTSFLGTVLLTAYFGGAVMTHLRVGDAFIFPIVFGILAWTSLTMRQPRILTLALGTSRNELEPHGANETRRMNATRMNMETR